LSGAQSFSTPNFDLYCRDFLITATNDVTHAQSPRKRTTCNSKRGQSLQGPSNSSTSTTTTSSSDNAQAPPATAQGRKSTTNNPPGQSHAVTEAASGNTRTPALCSVALTITPTHRQLALDARDGVVAGRYGWCRLNVGCASQTCAFSALKTLTMRMKESEGPEEEKEEEEGTRIRLGRGKRVS